MPISEQEYFSLRNYFQQNPDVILQSEQKYMLFLLDALKPIAQQIANDFSRASDLLPFWINYPPLQRGRAPSGLSIPWQEVGETVIGPHIIRAITLADSGLHHPGLPSGADIRFMTNDALVHLDIKVTGPNDRADEVVASPNQISGDGALWANGGIVNNLVLVQGAKATMLFQPELPPLYVVEGRPLLCLTYFLKGVYTVERLGTQPLDYLELICSPNGLMSFTGENYNSTVDGLFIPGKDEVTKDKKRVRVRMNPLEQLHAWRRNKFWSRL